MRLLPNRLFLLWLIIYGGVLQSKSQPSHFDAIPLTEKQKNVEQLLTVGKAPSAYFLCDSIFQFQKWSSQEEKLDFYAFFYDILFEVGRTNTEIKQYLVNRDYEKFEEVILSFHCMPNVGTTFRLGLDVHIDGGRRLST